MTMDQQMRQVLANLELLSHGSVSVWNASGGHSGEPDDRVVALCTRRMDVPHLTYRVLYERQRTADGQARVYEAAKAELESWTHRTAPRVESMSLEAVILEDGKNFGPEIVAQWFGVAPSFVRRLRQRAKVGTEDGRPIVEPLAPDVVERACRARDLKERGLSLRQIALNLRVSVATVSRDLAA